VRVLVAEDVPRLADDIAEGLRDQGMAVDVSYDGLDAVAKLNLVAYDVIVLDRDLPGLHGDAVCRMIADGEQPVMVLMLTAADEPGQRVAVRGLRLRAAGVELDQLARIATRDGRRLELSAKELAVLEALLRASPGVLSAESLLEQAWDENVDPFTKTVQVTIGRLRRKLGEPDVIQTLPGVGYRIAPAGTD
jgi:DNA-binding response OmpR family regulator